ncbi:MAG TPA: MmgE/PrpD family protein [Bordetella sp.]|jgi:2-methylcitrate dehydratase PrpD|nr:MmgE/PrpD family protein [Bordetella sp.]
MTTNSKISPATRNVSELIAGALGTSMSERLIEKAKHHIVDTVAAMISGADLDVGKRALATAPLFAGQEQATVIGTGQRLPVFSAAMLNAMLAHADETDDSHEKSVFHPGCAVVPAALAMAQLQRKGGRELIAAVSAGYDVGARVLEEMGAMALNHRGRSTHAVGALFGAGAAAGALAGFDDGAARRLLSYLGHEVSGLSCWMVDHDHVQKAYVFGAMAAKNAIFATMLTQAGWTGVDDVLRGDRTLFVAFGRGEKGRTLDEPMTLGDEILSSNIKKWCVGSPVQAPLDSLEALRDQLPPPERIRSVMVEIQANEAFIVDGRDMPNISLQHLSALYIVDRGLTFESAHDFARMADPVVSALRARVKLVPSEELQRSGGRQAIVTIETDDGRTLTHHTRAVRGTWGNPMPREEVDAKARDLIAPLMGAQRADALLAQLWRLETLDAATLDSLVDSMRIA